VTLNHIAVYFAVGSAIASLVSIAVCHILLILAFATILIARRPLRIPPFWPALLFLLLWTLLAVAMSDTPSAGWPAVRKFYCILTLVTLMSTLSVEWARRLFIGLAVAGTASAAWGLVQFWQKWERARAAGEPFYQSYIGDRITGFMSHWMTFGGGMMIVLVVIASWIFFAPDRRKLWLWWTAGAIVFAAIVLGFTRSIWPAAAVSGLYLLWFWKRWTVAAVPIVIGVTLSFAPSPIGERIRSIWSPDKRLDSNQHREALRTVGWRMIADHPMVGIGPEHTKRKFAQYLPEQYKPIPPQWYYGHLHNIYLDFAAERGIPALLAFLMLVGWALRDFLRKALRLSQEDCTRRMLLHGAVAGILAILVGGMLERNLGDSEVLTLFWTMLACGYTAVQQETEPHEPTTH